jgi:hypothetical protein
MGKEPKIADTIPLNKYTGKISTQCGNRGTNHT